MEMDLVESFEDPPEVLLKPPVGLGPQFGNHWPTHLRLLGFHKLDDVITFSGRIDLN